MSALQPPPCGTQLPLESVKTGTEEHAELSDLPFLVLAEIFDFFNKKEHRSLRLVSPAWNRVICQLYEASFRITHKTRLMALRSDMEIINASITAAIPKDPPFRTKLYKHMLFRSFCTRLQKLELTDLKFDINCLRLLENAVALRELRLYGVRCRPKPRGMNPSQNPDKFRKWLPMLRKFEYGKSSKMLLKIVALAVENGKLTDVGFETRSLGAEVDRAFLHYMRHGGNTNFENKLWQSIINSNKATLKTIRTFGRAMSFQNNELRNFVGEFGLYQVANSRLLEPWFEELLNQRNLQKLDLQIRDYHLGPVVIMNLTALGQSIPQIINHNVATLTEISLSCYYGFTLWDRNQVLAPCLDGIFSKCVSLKSLKLEYIKDKRRSYFPSGRPYFREIETLPRSLVYFSTDFPIWGRGTGLEHLNLANLQNLETLRMSPAFWFMFAGTYVTTFTTQHARILKMKLPKLKILSLNTAKKVYQLKQIENNLVEQFASTLESISPQSKFIHIDTRKI